MRFLDAVLAWANRWRERSWVTHAGILVPIALILWPVMHALAGRPLAQAGAAATAHYLKRELEQAYHKLEAGQPVDWLDAALDVLAPAVVALALAGLEALLL